MLGARFLRSQQLGLGRFQIWQKGGEDAEGGEERAGQDEAYDDAEDAGPVEIGIGQDQSEGKDAQDRAPDDIFAANFIAHRAADESSRGDSSKKEEEVQLRILNGEVKLAHEIKRVVIHQTGEIKKL